VKTSKLPPTKPMGATTRIHERLGGICVVGSCLLVGRNGLWVWFFIGNEVKMVEFG
jgi:hypothetical protein